MNAIDDGGPAFPLHIMEPHGDFANDERLPGLSLRDYFAGQAMAGFAHRASGLDTGGMYARLAYQWADAMIAERQKGPDAS